MLLGVCTLFSNEASFLEEFLDHLEDYVDELILVDTANNESCQNIVSSKGLEYHTHHWEEDFSKARNFALSKSRAKWVLHLDPDERLTAMDWSNLRNLLKDQTPDRCFLIQCINLRNFDWNTENPDILSQHTVLRLHPNNSGIQFTGKIHESIDSSAQELSLSIEELPKVKILHLGYAQNLYQEKVIRNQKIIEELVAKTGLDSPNLDPAILLYYSELHWNGNQGLYEALCRAYQKSKGRLRNLLAEGLFGWCLDFPNFHSFSETWRKELFNLKPDSALFLLERARKAILESNLNLSTELWTQLVPLSTGESRVSFYRPEILFHFSFVLACNQQLDLSLSIIQEFRTTYGKEAKSFFHEVKLLAAMGKSKQLEELLNSGIPDLSKLDENSIQELESIIAPLGVRRPTK